ncbi:MAG TPA: hypothetical protein VHW93_04805, partial [Acidimicrobiales bacterium]|nr:hypothetical protein [Acidimicrobiales bacterium]
MAHTWPRAWIGVALVCVGVFGAAFAVTGALAALPVPAVGGTCGPGRGSEAAIEAILHPASIGAGPEPAAADGTARQSWLAFVDECQSAANHRGVIVLVIGVVAIGLVAAGIVLMIRSRRRATPPAQPSPSIPAV